MNYFYYNKNNGKLKKKTVNLSRLKYSVIYFIRIVLQIRTGGNGQISHLQIVKSPTGWLLQIL